MARIIVNDFPAGPARGGRDSAPTPAAQIAMVACEFAAIDTTLRFSRRCTGERAAAPYFASQESRQDIRIRPRGTGQWARVTPGRWQDLP